MNLSTCLANSLWLASHLPAYARYLHALRDPAAAQRDRLRDLLQRHAPCSYGRAHCFSALTSYEDFARRVPMVSYEEVEPWVDRIRHGESHVLTAEPVTHLVPTSGSTGARKLVPFTMSLQREFNQAIAPWVADLARQSPTLLLGPAYWSISPAFAPGEPEVSAVPIGFEDDTAYLGGTRGWLMNSIMAVPSALRHVQDLASFRYLTLWCLLRQPDLRLISVWHPSYLTLLLDALPGWWDRLIADVHEGRCRTDRTLPRAVTEAIPHRPMPRRARELSRADPTQPETVWPNLRVISCWTDASAALVVPALQRRFPLVRLQPKGLLATEAFVSLPFANAHPLAVTSHFLEFRTDDGSVRLAHELRDNEIYEVVVTTGGGLWRYRLGDHVHVDGRVGNTPSVRFLGRQGRVSDRCGEKLSEEFITVTLREILAPLARPPRFVLLAPDEDLTGCRYTLYAEGLNSAGLAETLDHALRKNPHYAGCRDLGQLQPVRCFRVTEDGYTAFVRRQSAAGARLGEVKPASLSLLSGWSEIFSGAYEPPGSGRNEAMPPSSRW